MTQDRKSPTPIRVAYLNHPLGTELIVATPTSRFTDIFSDRRAARVYVGALISNLEEA